MVHTGSVTKVQGEGKQWLTKHGSLPEGFSICPVHTGMNPTRCSREKTAKDLPRAHGDEPLLGERIVKLDGFAPYTRG